MHDLFVCTIKKFWLCLFILQIAILGTDTDGLSSSTTKDVDSEKQAPPTGDKEGVATTPGEYSSVNPTGKRRSSMRK